MHVRRSYNLELKGPISSEVVYVAEYYRLLGLRFRAIALQRAAFLDHITSITSVLSRPMTFLIDFYGKKWI